MRVVLISDFVNRTKVVIPLVTLEQRVTNPRINDLWLSWGVRWKSDVDLVATVVYVAVAESVPNIWILRK